MGRGNVCVFGKYEGLFYLDKDFIEIYSKVNRCGCGKVLGFNENVDPMSAHALQKAGIEYDFDGGSADWAYDNFRSRDEWEFMSEAVQEDFMSRFKSFTKTDRRRGAYCYANDNNRHVVLENELFEIAVVDNEWSAAWMLLERLDITNRAQEHHVKCSCALSYYRISKKGQFLYE